MPNLRIITINGQVLEAVSAWAKIELVEGFSQVPEVSDKLGPKKQWAKHPDRQISIHSKAPVSFTKRDK